MPGSIGSKSSVGPAGAGVVVVGGADDPPHEPPEPPESGNEESSEMTLEEAERFLSDKTAERKCELTPKNFLDLIDDCLFLCEDSIHDATWDALVMGWAFQLEKRSREKGTLFTTRWEDEEIPVFLEEALKRRLDNQRVGLVAAAAAQGDEEISYVGEKQGRLAATAEFQMKEKEEAAASDKGNEDEERGMVTPEGIKDCSTSQESLTSPGRLKKLKKLLAHHKRKQLEGLPPSRLQLAVLKQQQETPASYSKTETAVKAEPRRLGTNLTKIFDQISSKSTSDEQNWLSSNKSYPIYAAQSFKSEIHMKQDEINQKFQGIQQTLMEAEEQLMVMKQKLQETLQLKQQLEETLEQELQNVVRMKHEGQQHFMEVKQDQNPGEARRGPEVQQHIGGASWVGGDSSSSCWSFGDSGPDAIRGMQCVPILGGPLFCSGCRGWGMMLPVSG